MSASKTPRKWHFWNGPQRIEIVEKAIKRGSRKVFMPKMLVHAAILDKVMKENPPPPCDFCGYDKFALEYDETNRLVYAYCIQCGAAVYSLPP